MLSKFLLTCKHKFLTIFIAFITMSFKTPLGASVSLSLLTGKKEEQKRFQLFPLPWDPQAPSITVSRFRRLSARSLTTSAPLHGG